MLDWYKQLIALRRTRPDLAGEPTRVRYDETAGWLRVERAESLVAANLGKEEQRVYAAEGSSLLLGSAPEVRLQGSRLVLPADTVGIVASKAQ